MADLVALSALAKITSLIKSIKDIEVKDGKDGKDGLKGSDGRDGKQGKQGNLGSKGRDGKDGPKGLAGKDGKDGKDGEDGEDGVGVVGVSQAADGDLVFLLSNGDEESLELPLDLSTNKTHGVTVYNRGGGSEGSVGEGVAAGGTTGQVLAKVDNTDYNTEWVANTGGGYDDTAIQAEVDLNSAKVSNVAHPLVKTAVPSGALFTDTVYTLDKAKVEAVLTGEISTHTHAGGGAAKSHGSFYLSTGGTTGLSSTAVQLVINNTGINSGDMVLASDTITVNKTAVFDINANVYLNNSSTARTEYSMWIEINNVEVAGTRFASYQRGYDSGMSSGVAFIASITSGDTVRIMCQRTDGTGTVGYQDDNGTRLNIREI